MDRKHIKRECFAIVRLKVVNFGVADGDVDCVEVAGEDDGGEFLRVPIEYVRDIEWSAPMG